MLAEKLLFHLVKKKQCQYTFYMYVITTHFTFRYGSVYKRKISIGGN